MKNWIKKLLNNFSLFRKPKEVHVKEELHKLLTIMDVNVYDDVFVKINDNIFEAWIIEKTANNISLCYTDHKEKIHEINFCIRGCYSQTKVINDNKTLILNKEEL